MNQNIKINASSVSKLLKEAAVSFVKNYFRYSNILFFSKDILFSKKIKYLYHI